MRILHTSDWHLNDRLGGRDRTADLRRRVEEIAAHCEEHRVDVLVIAGDVFSERCKVDPFNNELAGSLRHLRAVFRRFFDRGGIILAITGNHDQDGLIRDYIDIARAGMDLGEKPKAHGDPFEPGRMYFFTHSFVGRVRGDGFDVQFVLMPFPKHSSVLGGGERPGTAKDLDRVTTQFVADWIRDLPDSPGFDRKLRSVFVGHIRTVNADLGRAMAPPEGLVLDEECLVPFDYVALGDIHKPQPLKGMSHIRYSGSPDRLDFTEAEDAKSVVLVEIGPNGRVREPQLLPLNATTLRLSKQRDPSTAAANVKAAVAADPDAIVKVVLEGPAAESAAVEAEIRAAVPEARIIRERAALSVGSPVADPHGSVRERVMQYLAETLTEHPHRDAVLALATTHLDRLGHS